MNPSGRRRAMIRLMAENEANHPEQTPAVEYEWRQTEALRRFYRLEKDGLEDGSLRFDNSTGSRATGQFGTAIWTFKRTGFLAPKVSVRTPGSEADLALFSPGWSGGGSVSFASGRTYHLRQKNFWGSEWAFETEDGSSVIRLSAKHGVLKKSAAVRLSPAAVGAEETPILMLLIWYVRLLANEDAGAAVVAAGG